MLELALDADLSALATMADAVEGYAAVAGVPAERAMQLVVALDEILTRYGIDHTAEIYSGDHVSGVDRRLEAHVLPFFSRHLAFE